MSRDPERRGVLGKSDVEIIWCGGRIIRMYMREGLRSAAAVPGMMGRAVSP